MFRGLDDGYKITSISVPIGVLNFLWLEEFYEISKEEDFDILDESIRGQLPEGYWKRMLISPSYYRKNLKKPLIYIYILP